MGTPAPVTVHDMTVELDYGQFTLSGTSEGDSDLSMLGREAQIGPCIASDDHTVLVCVPHQNNFDMALRVEVWAEPPPRDFGQWEEIFECALEVDGGELSYGSPTMGSRGCEVPDGRYGVRICGRGFVNRGWPGSTRPGDVWRVQLWPTRRNLPDRRIRAWRPPEQGAAPVLPIAQA
ncbi:hypothetical protein KBX37_12980 [Micromonospora sp. U56]|uniref:hypothetical protein n=1 Tax=Micromonospora sp. U56 TaxID=2824900 RepID=UPI001B39AB4B|nr:hypothetical protein [Micromonospora sp. U56]MBQ0893999.1 hypothetical protein [Micromonospora sp. U56]